MPDILLGKVRRVQQRMKYSPWPQWVFSISPNELHSIVIGKPVMRHVLWQTSQLLTFVVWSPVATHTHTNALK